MYQFENLSDKPLTERVTDNILSYLADNNIEIGTKLPNEFKLAELFGVGRSTVREAIKILCTENILEIRRGSGTFVINTKIKGSSKDPLGLSVIENRQKLALDLLDIRLMIEPEIACLAAQNATEDQIKELYERCDEVEKLITEGKNHIPLDIEFHICIAKCSQNTVVEHILPIINSSVAVFANFTHYKLKQETIETHRAIVASIADRDCGGAKKAMCSHLEYNRQMINQIIEETKI